MEAEQGQVDLNAKDDTGAIMSEASAIHMTDIASSAEAVRQCSVPGAM